VHYLLWFTEVGCAKVASSMVEVVFSGAGRISMKSHCLDPQIRSNCAFLHNNYKYNWIRPKLEEIVTYDLRLYSKESCESDNESDGSDGIGGLDEEAGEQDGDGGGEED
jgi:hypothetical protein